MKKKLAHPFTAATAKSYALMTSGVFLTAASFNFFFIGNDIAPGGITGVATLLHHLFSVPVGVTSALLNIPLFLLGFRTVGKTFAFRSFLAMIGLSLFLDVLPIAPFTGDMLLASVYGGILMGFGVGLVMRGGATTGGTDLAAMLVHKHFPIISVGTVLFLIDCMVVVAAGFVFDAQASMYALIAILLSARLTDLVVQGWNTSMQFFIISEKADAIAARILAETERGATLLGATGAYSGEPKGMVYCVVSRTEVSAIKQIIASEDPLAFVTLTAVHEAMGEGFSGLKGK